MDKDGYPDDDDLKRVKDWDAIADPKGLFLFVADLWKYDDYKKMSVGRHGFLKDREVIRLEFHTGGWSGNEDLMDALLNGNGVMGVGDMFLNEWRRGGHYYFEIPKEYNEDTKTWESFGV